MGASSAGSVAGPASDLQSDCDYGRSDVERPGFLRDLLEQIERETPVFEEPPHPIDRRAPAFPVR